MDLYTIKPAEARKSTSAAHTAIVVFNISTDSFLFSMLFSIVSSFLKMNLFFYTIIIYILQIVNSFLADYAINKKEVLCGNLRRNFVRLINDEQLQIKVFPCFAEYIERILCQKE